MKLLIVSINRLVCFILVSFLEVQKQGCRLNTTVYRRHNINCAKLTPINIVVYEKH
jgi:hypothetical protein